MRANVGSEGIVAAALCLVEIVACSLWFPATAHAASPISVVETRVASIPAGKTPETWGTPLYEEGDGDAGIIFGDGVTTVFLYDFKHRNIKSVNLTNGKVTVLPGLPIRPLCGAVDSSGRKFLLTDREWAGLPQSPAPRWELFMAKSETNAWESLMQFEDSTFGYWDGHIQIDVTLEFGFATDGTLYLADHARALPLFRDGRPLPRSEREVVRRPTNVALGGVASSAPWPMCTACGLGVDASGNTFDQSVQFGRTKRSRDGKIIATFTLPGYTSPVSMLGSGILVTPNGDLLRAIVRLSGVTLYRYATGKL